MTLKGSPAISLPCHASGPEQVTSAASIETAVEGCGRTRKPRVLILSALIPVERSGGGCLALRRHFLLREDFDVAIATIRGDAPQETHRYQIGRNPILWRLRTAGATRLSANLEYLWNWFRLPGDLVSFAREFQPDVIFTVADDLHMGLAWQLSRRLDVPLAVNFQDLFAVSLFESPLTRPYPGVRQFLLNRYRLLNSRADLVLHTSEGMREWFSPHQRGDVLYPVPDGLQSKVPSVPPAAPAGRIKLLYTGNSTGAYGRMLLQLAREVIDDPRIDFRIFTRASDWPADEQRRLEDAGIYRGFLPFEELRSQLAEADAFLSVMSFEPEQQTFMRTSFTTKCGDYVPWGRPLFIWGPEYSSACRFVRKYQAGVAIEQNSAAAVVQAVVETARDERAWRSLCAGALAAAAGQLNADQIHNVLRLRLNGLRRASAGAADPPV